MNIVFHTSYIKIQKLYEKEHYSKHSFLFFWSEIKLKQLNSRDFNLNILPFVRRIILHVCSLYHAYDKTE
jgi:hypothetical protein